MSKMIGVLTSVYISILLAYHSAYAACPVCAVAVGGGVAIANHYGIDYTIIGLWVGALIATFIGMTIKFLNKIQIKFIGRKPLIAALYLVIIVWPLYHKKYIGLPEHTLWGIDKMLLGIFLGIVTFCVGCLWYSFLKQRNNNRAYFPLQKVCMPIGLLLMVSFVLYCITR